MLDEVVEQLDESLFSEYVKAKASVVNAIIKKGISESGIDWYDTPRPTGKSFWFAVMPAYVQ
jgi:exocyst complex component 2